MQDLAEIQLTLQEKLQILTNNGVNFDANRVKWALTSDECPGLENAINNNAGQNAKLRQTKIVFLEEGVHDPVTDKGAGLEHIYQRHATQFEAKNPGINSRAKISEFIRDVMTTKGELVDQGANSGGIKLTYKINNDNNNKLKVAIGSNGFIVTAHPV